MSDSEYTESLDAGQEESEENDRTATDNRPQAQLLYQQQPQNSYMHYAGSTSSSGGDSSVSSTSSEDSDGDQDSEDSWEITKITHECLSLPRGLCENPAIFHEFFSLATWQELPVPIQNHLQQFLPDFGQANLPPQIAAVEKARTLSMLFSGSLHRFQQTPLVQLQRQLEAGNYRPDIRKLKDNILKSQRRERKFQHCERLSHMAKQLFLSRQRLLDHSYKSLPDVATKLPQPSSTNAVSSSSKRHAKPLNLYRDNKLSAIRARKRFFSEISQITQNLGIPDNIVLSADEEDDSDRLLDDDMKRDLLQQQRSVEQESEAAAAKPNTPMAERCVYSTLFRKRSDCEDEAAFRLQQKNRQTRLTNTNFKEYLREHKRRKITEPTLPEFETSDIRLRDVCGRAQIGGNFKRIFGTGKTPGRKPKATSVTSAAASEIAGPSSNSTTPALITPPKQQQQQLLSFPSAPGAMQQPQHQLLQQHHSSLPQSTNLSEPPALVPIQPTIKKSDSYHQQLSAAASMQTPPRTQQHLHTEQKTMQQPTSELNDVFNKSASNCHNNSSDTLNISSFMSTHPDNLNLCIDEASLLAGDHDAFSMLDSEVELQQEEVETFAGSSDDNLTSFVIGDDIVLGSRNDTTSTPMLRAPHRNDKTKMNTANTLSSQPLPKLEPILRNSDSATKPNNKLNVSQTSCAPAVPTAVNCASELIQETHACFFSLIRDFFCSTLNHRMRYDDLKTKIDTWLRNPITALNEWYAMAENWSNLLRSAINFMLGDFADIDEDFVPYIEHKVQLNIFQWIGAGRDSDARLTDLCSYWMEKRKLLTDPQQQKPSQLHQDHRQSFIETKLEVLPKSLVENDESAAENGSIITPPPPPPRCPTNWTVRAATMEEIEEFQRQERERFEQPHKAYTYRMYGYESVVAPVKGIYTPMLALSKPRGHSMMVEHRPNFVTILTLVRDATARLPNGEGTRADISELLTCSQYINQDAAENVLQTIVSGALDRMHTEHDPCVRYDPKKKIWIYLHRDRSEEDFERIHHQNHNVGKTKKLPPQQRKSKSALHGVQTKLNSPEMETVTTSGASMETANGALLSLPALVPSNPIVVSNANAVVRTQTPQHQQLQLSKCPPVPPLKYNIPPSSQQHQQQQQKSLLKSAVRLETKANVQAVSTQNKQHQFQVPANKSSNPSSNSAPMIVATPQGLQTVHLSNVTNSSNNSQQQQQYQPTQQHSNLTANLAGKRVMLNKPIIINQVTNQQQKNHNTSVVTSTGGAKLKSSQQVLKHHQGRVHTLSPQQQQQMQQLQSNVITIPISMTSNLSVNTGVSSSDHHQTDKLNTQSQLQKQQQHQQLPAPTSVTNRQNIIRIVPAGQQIINRQSRVMPSTNLPNAERPQTPQQFKTTGSNSNNNASNSIQQLLTNNGNIITVNSGTGQTTLNTTATSGSIVKMSAQAFTALQQKQGATAASQQPHILVKQGTTSSQPAAKTQQVQNAAAMKPQRIILGNTAVMAQSVVHGKNIIFQQIPMSSAGSVVVASPTSTTTVASASNTTNTGNKIQAINAANLTPQQQRILIQNLKQQQQKQQQAQGIPQHQIQYKTIQVMTNANAATQHNVMQRTSQAITVATSSPQTTTKSMVTTLSPQDIGATPQQHQTNLTRIIKTSPQLKSEGVSSRVITSSSGQIISLDSLIQKQGGTLRIAGTGGGSVTAGHKSNGNRQISTTTQFQKVSSQQQQQQQPTQQFAIVSVPNSIISLGSSNNFTVGQRIITTQAATGAVVNTTIANVEDAKVTPSILATSNQRRIITTPTGSKIVAKSNFVAGGGVGATGGTSNIRLVNTVQQAGGINLATLQGKQVVLTSGKSVTALNKAQIQNSQKQSNILQTVSGGSIVIGGQTIKLQQGNPNIQQLLNKSGNIIATQPASSNQTTGTGQMQTVIMGNQILRVQQMPQIVTAGSNRLASTSKTVNNSEAGTVVTTNIPKTILVGSSGQTLRLQPSASSANITQVANKNIIVNTNQQNVVASALKTATNHSLTNTTTGTSSNRVVLAVQGGGQIFLSPNFQGGSNINLKSLQGLKMVSLAQSKDRQAKANTPTPSSSLSSSVNVMKTNSTASNTTVSDGNL